MKLGKDFVRWARFFLGLLKFILQFAQAENEDLPGDGKEIQ